MKKQLLYVCLLFLPSYVFSMDLLKNIATVKAPNFAKYLWTNLSGWNIAGMIVAGGGSAALCDLRRTYFNANIKRYNYDIIGQYYCQNTQCSFCVNQKRLVDQILQDTKYQQQVGSKKQLLKIIKELKEQNIKGSCRYTNNKMSLFKELENYKLKEIDHYSLSLTSGVNYFFYDKKARFYPYSVLWTTAFSILYVPFYYFLAKAVINGMEWNINPLYLMSIAEVCAIILKAGSLHRLMSKKNPENIRNANNFVTWDNPDQMYLSALVWVVTGALMHQLNK